MGEMPGQGSAGRRPDAVNRELHEPRELILRLAGLAENHRRNFFFGGGQFGGGWGANQCAAWTIIGRLKRAFSRAAVCCALRMARCALATKGDCVPRVLAAGFDLRLDDIDDRCVWHV